MNWLKTLEMIFQIVCLSAVFLIPTYVFFNELKDLNRKIDMFDDRLDRYYKLIAAGKPTDLSVG